MNLRIDDGSLHELVAQIVSQVLSESGLVDWKPGRCCLSEAEAAEACGVGKHVLRDLRLAGRIKAIKLGRRAFYTRAQLLEALGKLGTTESEMDVKTITNTIPRRSCNGK